VEFIDLPKAIVRVRVEGQGRLTVVFIADPPNVLEHYDTLFELLSTWARVVCFEAPGFGFSIPKRGFTFSFQEYAQTAADLLKALRAEPYVLAFPCVGAYTALRVAADHPALVSRLLLLQAPVWSEQVKWSRAIDRTGVIATPYVGQAFMAWRKRWVMQYWYRVALPKTTRVAPFVAPALKAFERGASFSWASLCQRWFSAKEPSFASVTQPTLVLWGMSDRSHRHTNKRSILEYVPTATVMELEGIGHFPELEDPHRFREILGALIALGKEPQ
jgi:pimeloyl-ACP methyl ester carboxylesterase